MRFTNGFMMHNFVCIPCRGLPAKGLFLFSTEFSTASVDFFEYLMIF